MPISALKQGKGSVHTIDSLAVHFGIKDMGTKTQPQPQREVTPDDEYYTYVNGDLWDDGSDPLKFWEMLKYDYKKSRLTFTEGTKLHQHDLLDDEPEELDCDSGGALVLHQEEAVDTLIESASQEEVDQLQADIILVDF
ncbi:hypothetical protein PISMIDRAFT_11094 [Pisolithus microcarpus 441]|uniref:Uncharacterized protein n=1 Tax=Pisolithus microcarpus 441 TaxID=765257 RepID=A0A0C9ZLE6_9AGAM|nr:hypothetical protein PISMIDRAFT_11094 [Pisolithus microcarpus 441]